MIYTLRWHEDWCSQDTHYEILAGEEVVFSGFSHDVDSLLRAVGVLFTEEHVNG